jgi:hypothetical protein
VEHLPLHAELTLPVRAPRELRAACDPARPLAPAEQIALHEELSAVQGGDRIGRIELRVRETWRRSDLRELVTGHAGCGESTELLRRVGEHALRPRRMGLGRIRQTRGTVGRAARWTAVLTAAACRRG